jgi:CheY-like chemotaxis protein
MLIVCPNCKNRFDVDPVVVEAPKKLRCSSCRAVFGLVRKAQTPPGIPVAPAAPVPTAAPATHSPSVASEKLKVVIANESVAFCEAVQKILAGEPFELFICNDGREALDAVERIRPQLLLLDVALPTMFGFEVCERVRQNPELAGLKIVLIASIYDKTRYKRSPNSLYGADDYIEKHHIPDSLIPMIYGLTSGHFPVIKSPSPSELAAQEETRCEIRQAEVSATCCAAAGAPPFAAPAQAALQVPQPSLSAAAPAESPAPELAEAESKARRLARIIVSDIVLYNQAKVELGVRDGSLYALLADDIREGEHLYRQRVPEQVRENSSFLKDAFEELIAKKRAEMRM